MRRIIGLLLSVLLLPIFTASGHDGLKETFQEGLFHEEAEQDIKAAIEAYESVLTQHVAEDRLVATAIFRLGECYRKQGNKEKAAEQYQRLLREYPQQKTLAELSRQNLSGMGRSVPSKGKGETATSMTSTEAKRIKELKEMVRNSPDLINALGKDGKTPLQKAAAQGRLRVARFLIDNGAEVLMRDKAGRTAFHEAATNGHKAIAELLIAEAKKSATKEEAVDPRDRQELTPLHLAAVSGHRILTEFLLKNGAAVNAKAADTPQPSGNVSSGIQPRLFAIINRGSRPRRTTPLHLGAVGGHVGVTEVLLEHDASIDPQSSAGMTPLLMAVGAEQFATVKYLLENEADLTVKNREGKAPWPQAVEHGVRWVRLFLEHGADPNASIGAQLTPVMMATNNEDLASVSLLLKEGADPNQTASGMSALHLATKQGLPKIVTLLLEHGGDAELRNDRGWTPLQVAVSEEDRQVCAGLLEAGANPNVNDEHTKQTPLHWALDFGRDRSEPSRGRASGRQRPDPDKEAIARLLLKHGASVDAQDKNGNTPVHFAVYDASVGMLNRVLQEDPDLEIQNEDGWTPLEEACFSDPPNREKIKALLEAGADPDFTYIAVVKEVEPWVVKMLVEAGGPGRSHHRQRETHTASCGGTAGAWRDHQNTPRRRGGCRCPRQYSVDTVA